MEEYAQYEKNYDEKITNIEKYLYLISNKEFITHIVVDGFRKRFPHHK